MKTLFVILALIQIGCNAQNKETNSVTNEKNNNQNKAMETFDIDTYNKNKDQAENYIFTLDDGTKVTQFGNQESGYYEYSRKQNSFFEKRKSFYASGKLKIDGTMYFNSYQKGIWNYYDEQENLEKTIDYDQPFTYTWDDILKFVKEKKIDLSKNTTRISRTTEGVIPTWGITWHYDSGRLKSITINGKTGEIVEEKFLIMEKL
ncbi:hypothetical protein [Aquimarina sp. MAR_2010_214]|uniref:hypothetical protein n=1 Tax=Aquimarina sp. MAR_2010_214 TaxID=1250026 RepID=UPI00117889EB|nr:hypothetical protein [Aquimarina sp. MAR_2010_214]